MKLVVGDLMMDMVSRIVQLVSVFMDFKTLDVKQEWRASFCVVIFYMIKNTDAIPVLFHPNMILNNIRICNL